MSAELQTELVALIAEAQEEFWTRWGRGEWPKAGPQIAFRAFIAERVASAFCPIVVLLDGTIMSEDWEPLYAFRPKRQLPNG